MFAALILAVSISTGWPDGDVGPIRLGEPVAQVQKTLGPGWRGHVEDDGNKGTALVYTDGVDQLQVWISSDPAEGETVEGIVARENRAQGAPFARHVPLRTWRWPGGTLFEMPAALRGWHVTRWSPPRFADHEIASYEHPDGVVVWFTENAWRGVDFHWFAD